MPSTPRGFPELLPGMPKCTTAVKIQRRIPRGSRRAHQPVASTTEFSSSSIVQLNGGSPPRDRR
jgi:hypothetical protein